MITDLTREEMRRIARQSVCAQCGAFLNILLDTKTLKDGLACSRFPLEHEGIVRHYEPREKNIPTRREEMVNEIGQEKVKALAKYEGVVSLNKAMAIEILEAIWPEAPIEEKGRAALLCATQQLNPLMKHVFLVPFNKGKENESWATVIGISAKRLMASRRGAFSYVDDTPRVMTEAEQIKRFGSAKTDTLVAIVKLKDPATGAEAVGYGEWPLKKWDKFKNTMVDNNPHGTDKGNSMFNMASIRAESQALNRLRPGDMPENIMVMDDAIAEDASRKGVIEGECKVVEEEPPAPGKEPELPSQPPTPQKTGVESPDPTQDMGNENKPARINMDWLIESLNTLKARAPKTWGPVLVQNKLKAMGATVKQKMSETIGTLPEDAQVKFAEEVQEALKLVGA